MLSNLGRDVRFALRSLRRDRGFALTAILSIGLGVGANAAIFSLVNQALLRRLPVHEPDRLVLLNWRGSFVGKGWGSSNLMSYPFYRDLRDETNVFDGVFGGVSTCFWISCEATSGDASGGGKFSATFSVGAVAGAGAGAG